MFWPQTLDRSYHLGLSGTEQRDKDQILSKSLIKPEDSPEDKPEDKPEDTPENKPEDTPEDKPEDKPEDTPEDKPDRSRLLMVPQLWLWKIDQRKVSEPLLRNGL